MVSPRVPARPPQGSFAGWQGDGWLIEATRLGSISPRRTHVAKRTRSPFGSAVKAGEPCRGLARGGEPEPLGVGNLWPGKERGHLRVPRGVRLRSPTHRVGRRPPPPGRGDGGVRPVPRASACGYTCASALYGAPSNTHRRPAAATAAATSAAKPGASSSPSASRSMCRASSRAATSRASLVFPLPAQPTTTTRSGIGRMGTGRTVMPVDGTSRGAGSPKPAGNLASSHESTNKMGEIVDAVPAHVGVIACKGCG
jgi:hypothetical protein